MEIEIDRDACAGTGLCAMTAPEVFEQDALDGRVRLREAHPDADLMEPVREAVDLCPTAALVLLEQNTEPQGE